MYQQLQKFKGMHVVALEEGQDMDTIHKVFLDPEKKQVSGLTIRESRFSTEDKWVDIDKVAKLGNDYLFISKADDCHEQQPQGRNLKDLMGTQVMTKDGTLLGSLVDIEIDLSKNCTVPVDAAEAVFGQDTILLKAGVKTKQHTEPDRDRGFLAKMFGRDLVQSTAEALSRAEKKSPKEKEASDEQAK